MAAIITEKWVTFSIGSSRWAFKILKGPISCPGLIDTTSIIIWFVLLCIFHSSQLLQLFKKLEMFRGPRETSHVGEKTVNSYFNPRQNVCWRHFSIADWPREQEHVPWRWKKRVNAWKEWRVLTSGWQDHARSKLWIKQWPQHIAAACSSPTPRQLFSTFTGLIFWCFLHFAYTLLTLTLGGGEQQQNRKSTLISAEEFEIELGIWRGQWPRDRVLASSSTQSHTHTSSHPMIHWRQTTSSFHSLLWGALKSRP